MNIKNFGLVTFGVLIGSVVSYVYTKNKYEEILNNEIESVKEQYKNRKDLIVNDNNDNNDNNEEELSLDENINSKKVESNTIIDYRNISKKYLNDIKEHDNVDDKYNDPYVIEPEEFGEDGYDTCSLTYYSDGIVVDDVDEIVSNDDLDEYVGPGTIDIFDEYNAKSIIVRNELFRIDYEIIKDDCKYSDLYSDTRELEHSSYIKQKEKKPHEIE